MGPNQHRNWCVVWPWFDDLVGTRRRFVGTAKELAGRLRHLQRATDARLGASDRYVVFRVRRSVRVLDAATGKARRIATAAGRPIGLSIEGARIAWAENVHGHGRIRALRVG